VGSEIVFYNIKGATGAGSGEVFSFGAGTLDTPTLTWLWNGARSWGATGRSPMETPQ